MRRHRAARGSALRRTLTSSHRVAVSEAVFHRIALEPASHDASLAIRGWNGEGSAGRVPLAIQIAAPISYCAGICPELHLFSTQGDLSLAKERLSFYA